MYYQFQHDRKIVERIKTKEKPYIYFLKFCKHSVADAVGRVCQTYDQEVGGFESHCQHCYVSLIEQDALSSDCFSTG